ncbi:MAG: M48 family metalloprotease, partial [Thermodesulfobacteriota bacterium]|nr:M48 family metalloprotease [Thermodesulfobacteriota bacterium]
MCYKIDTFIRKETFPAATMVCEKIEMVKLLSVPVLMLVMIGCLLLGCAVHPVTLDKQLMIISEEKEIAIGERSDSLIVQQFGYYDDPAMQEYVNNIGQKLVSVCARKNIKYHFTVLDSPDVNAFACPGGFIYVTRGILAIMNSEAELAGVLGHEIGHVVGRDSANMISQQSMFQVLALAGMAAGSTSRELAMAGN